MANAEVGSLCPSSNMCRISCMYRFSSCRHVLVLWHSSHFVRLWLLSLLLVQRLPIPAYRSLPHPSHYGRMLKHKLVIMVMLKWVVCRWLMMIRFEIGCHHFQWRTTFDLGEWLFLLCSLIVFHRFLYLCLLVSMFSHFTCSLSECCFLACQWHTFHLRPGTYWKAWPLVTWATKDWCPSSCGVGQMTPDVAHLLAGFTTTEFPFLDFSTWSSFQFDQFDSGRYLRQSYMIQ